jgi:hypothetical protein
MLWVSFGQLDIFRIERNSYSQKKKPPRREGLMLPVKKSKMKPIPLGFEKPSILGQPLG